MGATGLTSTVIFTQSNFGILTKLGVWLMKGPPPGGYFPFLMKFPKVEMLADIIKTLMPLRLNQIIPNACIVVNAGWEAAGYFTYDENGKGTNRDTFYRKKDSLPPKVFQQIMDKYGCGAWNFYAALYGSPEQVALNWKYVSGAFKAEVRQRGEDHHGEGGPGRSYLRVPQAVDDGGAARCRNSASTTGGAVAARCGSRRLRPPGRRSATSR